jgi:DNA-directed RNA polymerase I subunit RPA1
MKVFEHYGIKVDHRHCYLVTDYMCFNGFINPLSRNGIQHSSSPLLKMSFETTMKFMIDACTEMNKDILKTPSASLVFGNPVNIGTGFFQVRQALK